MNKLLAVALLVSIVGVACKKDDGPATGGPASGATPTSGGAKAPAGGETQAVAGQGPVAVTAAALFEEHLAAGGVMPDLGHKYDAGVLVSGSVGKIVTDLGTTFVQLKAGEHKWIALTFVDQGAAVRAKGIKVDDAITVSCQLGGMGGPTEAILGGCTLP